MGTFSSQALRLFRYTDLNVRVNEHEELELASQSPPAPLRHIRGCIPRLVVAVVPGFAPGRGVFVCGQQGIPEGSFVCEYTGEVVNSYSRVGDFIMELTNGTDIDGEKHGNVGRFLNHASLRAANCNRVFANDTGEEDSQNGTRVFIMTNRHVHCHEQLCFDYGDFGKLFPDIFGTTPWDATRYGTLRPS